MATSSIFNLNKILIQITRAQKTAKPDSLHKRQCQAVKMATLK